MTNKPLLARIVWGRFFDQRERERSALESLLQQTPHGLGRWGEVQFTIDPVESCDFLLIADLPTRDVTVKVPPDNVWSFTMEPPNEFFWRYHLGHPGVAKTFTSSSEFYGDHLVNIQVPINWHIGLSFDQLIEKNRPEKAKMLSYITSSMQAFAGHRTRLEFTKKLMQTGLADVYGRGINEIPRKWDVISPYNAVIVVENHKNPLYWSEKIADAYLGYAMPIYYGCTSISDYFPEESLIRIDIEAPDVFNQITEIISDRPWEKRVNAIYEARHKILYQHNFFPFFEEQIRAAPVGSAKRIIIPAFKYSI